MAMMFDDSSTFIAIGRWLCVKIGLLGAGGFGAVELWEHKSTGETYVPWMMI